MKPLSWGKQIFVWLMTSFLILGTLGSMLLVTKEINAINRDEPISGKKTLGYIKDIHMNKMKKFCKDKNCTVNDYCSSVLSIALHEYF